MIWWILAALCAFFVKGLSGFANTLVFTSILSFGADNINISPVELLLGFPTNIILAWKERRHINWKVCIPTIALILAGSIPGILFLKNADSGFIKIIFGFIIILIGIEMLIREMHPRKMKESKILLGIIGIISGVLCGLYGIGALLGAYISRITDDTHAFKANICMVFTVENIFRIVLYTIWGIITLESLKQAIILVTFMLIGLKLGMVAGNVMDEKLVKKIVIVLLIISGTMLIINNL